MDGEKLEGALEKMGLTVNGTKTYLALLCIGATSSGALVEKTGLHIPRVYDALRGLMHKGLVSYVMKNKKKIFEAAPPDRLMDLLKEQEREFAVVLPELRKLERSTEAKPEPATIFSGVRGLRTVLDSVLEEVRGGGEYVDFGVSGLFRKTMGAYWDIWQKMKKERRIRSRCIFDEKVRGSDIEKEYYGKARFAPSRFFCPSDTMIFRDKVVIFAWTAEPPTAVVIKDAATAHGYKNIFEWMWRNAKV